eukprot:6208043-Amphidinium_carterae.1
MTATSTCQKLGNEPLRYGLPLDLHVRHQDWHVDIRLACNSTKQIIRSNPHRTPMTNAQRQQPQLKLPTQRHQSGKASEN